MGGWMKHLGIWSVYLVERWIVQYVPACGWNPWFCSVFFFILCQSKHTADLCSPFSFQFISSVWKLAVWNGSLEILIKRAQLCLPTDPPLSLDINSTVSPLHTYYLVCLDKQSQITQSFSQHNMQQPGKLITSVHYLTPQSHAFENTSDPNKAQIWLP